jgi:hypothetical protein
LALTLCRTHRQRTQGYIRELEREVLRLRELEINLKNQNKILSAKVTILEQTLTINNITVPDLTSVGATSQLIGSSLGALSLSGDYGYVPSQQPKLVFNQARRGHFAGRSAAASPGREASDSETAWSTISGHTPGKGRNGSGLINVDLTSMLDMPGFRVTGHNIENDIVEPIDVADLDAPPHPISLSTEPGSTNLDTQEALDFVLG